MTLKFDGSAYHGWQRQENAVTVQQRVEEAVDSVFHEGASVCGCSRTDAGVHALMFCCNFHTGKTIPISRIPAALNACLPPDIAVFDARDCAPQLHARYSCSEKEYCYRILNTPYRDPFWLNKAYHYPYPLDAAFLNGQAADLLGRHDFSAFCAAGSAVQNKVRTISDVSVTREGEMVVFRIRGDGFLYHMVRIAVGTLLYIAQNKRNAGDIPLILASRDRERAGFTAPPQGLYLTQVFYRSEVPTDEPD